MPQTSFFSASHPSSYPPPMAYTLLPPPTIGASNYATAQLLVLKDRPIPCVYQHSRGSRFDTIRDKTNFSSTFRTWRRIGNGVLQTPEIQSLPNPEGCFWISPCFADIYRCKATENFNFFQPKNLKMFPALASRRFRLARQCFALTLVLWV